MSWEATTLDAEKEINEKFSEFTSVLDELKGSINESDVVFTALRHLEDILLQHTLTGGDYAYSDLGSSFAESYTSKLDPKKRDNNVTVYENTAESRAAIGSHKTKTRKKSLDDEYKRKGGFRSIHHERSQSI